MLEKNANIEQLSGHIIICGLGHVGYRCLNLLNQLGEKAVVISPGINDKIDAADLNCPVIKGDARSEICLRGAGIEKARSIIIVTNDDMSNISIALDARRLNPQIVIVLRMFDTELAAGLEGSLKINRIWSASSIAAPAFAAAAVGEAIQGSFLIDDKSCVIEECQIGGDSPAQGLALKDWSAQSGQRAIAVRREGKLHFNLEQWQLADHDSLILLRQLPDVKKRDRRAGWLRSMADWLAFWWHDVPGVFRIALLFFFLIIVLSVIVFHFSLNISLIDSFYFAITTITTTGYGDYNLRDAPAAVKLYGIFLMLSGAAVVALIFSILTDALLKLRFRDAMSLRCTQLKGHIIVAGLGSVGLKLIRELVCAGQTVVGIEIKEGGPFISEVREIAHVIAGNARTKETLQKAGAAGAKAIVAATDNDLVNLSTVLNAKQINPQCRSVVRIFDSDLAEKIQQGMEFDRVLSVSAVAAPIFVGSALAADVFYGLLLDMTLVLLFRRKSSDVAASNERILFAVRNEVVGIRWFELNHRRKDI